MSWEPTAAEEAIRALVRDVRTETRTRFAVQMVSAAADELIAIAGTDPELQPEIAAALEACTEAIAAVTRLCQFMSARSDVLTQQMEEDWTE